MRLHMGVTGLLALSCLVIRPDAADVYAASGHVGRGGWTWYTGSAGLIQRAGIESILGLRIEGDKLRRSLYSRVLAPVRDHVAARRLAV